MGVVFEDDVSGAWNEMFSAPGQPRPIYERLLADLNAYQPQELRLRSEQLAHTFIDRGVTFAHSGEERPFPLDLVPRILGALEWDRLSRGIAQRVRALEAFLADIYGEGRIFDEGLMPRRVVTSSPHFNRAAFGITPPNGVRITVAGIDLIRDEHGNFCVLEDNVRIPSGVSYVIENRRAMTQAFSALFSDHRVHPVDSYPSRLFAALLAAAPAKAQDPVIVVLSPGVFNAAYFEHVLLARMMGVELVEGRDLVCRSNHVYMRTTNGERAVHVIYRRVDDDWIDPLQFRPDTVIGVAGLVNAARAGNVVISNGIGNGVADDKLVYTFVPEFIRFYLGEKPLLDNIETHRLEDDEARAEVLGHLERYVVKPVDGSGGKGIVIGPQATKTELKALAKEVASAPRNFIAQRPVALSTHPTFVDESIVPRHIDLRPFAVNNGEEVWVLPGGLTRVALGAGELIVNSSRGGGSKDTWVLNDESIPFRGAVPPASARSRRYSGPPRQNDEYIFEQGEQ
ncbi:MAG: circularly permuted type 2 ATP-grasp protein [Acidimicrobiaceae bacterium]|nr:circularly permuted type 2 ATP-grasp protein [Acidimicrobiaceae bacterium]